jgi:hypothetical protein
MFTELGSGAFDGCSSLPSFTIPEGVTNIGAGAFSDCDTLTEMVVPATASIAEGTTFYDCENLRRVELHCDGIVGSYTFGYCYNLSELIITGNLTQFDMCAFNDCTSLTSFTFTDSVAKIEASAFSGCGFQEITFLGDAPEFGSDAFSGVTATAYYNESNPTWTEDKLQNYGGNLTWVNGHIHEFTEDAPVFDPETNTHYTPYVVEPSLGADRVALAFLVDAYDEEEIAEGDVRVVLHLHPALAPIKAAVLPLSKKLSDKALELYDDLAKAFPCDFDEAGSIGKRYRRQDEVGTPFCITYDFDTETDGCVTVRDRDSMEQVRLPIAEVKAYIQQKLTF